MSEYKRLELIDLPGADEIEVDLADPGGSTIHGTFRQTWNVSGRPRSIITYMPEDWHHNNRGIVVAAPADADLLAYIPESGFQAFADKTKVLLAFIEAENGVWNTDGSDADFFNAAYKKLLARDAYVVMQDAVYAMGVGDGATIAMQAVIKMSSEWSGLATFGQLSESVFSEYLQKADADTGQTFNELFVSGKKAQMPVWMSVAEEDDVISRLREYWKKENKSQDTYVTDDRDTKIYLPRPLKKTRKNNDDNIAQVRITLKEDPQQTDAETLEYIWDYVGAARRHRSYNVKVLRYFRDPLKTGASHHTLTVDGICREWYEYVPSCAKDSDTRLPLVVCMHGRGGNGETFYDITDIALAAEERHFIAVCPTASIYQDHEGGFRGIRLWMGEYKGERINCMNFIRAMVKDVESRLPVDKARVYACGQSSGGYMTGYCGLAASDIFTAVTPWSGYVTPIAKKAAELKYYEDSYLEGGHVPVFLMFGDSDKFFGFNEPFTDPSIETPLTEYIAFLRQEYGLEETPSTYICYPVTYYEWHNPKGTPMLKIGVVDDMPHANYAEQTFISYDEFMSKFTKDEQGNRYYMGRPAE